MSKRIGLIIMVIFVAWALVYIGKPEPERTVITGPFVHQPMKPVWQDVDLLDPPDSARAPVWKPGDPVIDPGDIQNSFAGTTGVKSWFRRLLRRICCTIFPCKPKAPEQVAKPVEPTGVTGVVNVDGIPGDNYRVPDPVGDIGPDHYVQAVNSAFQVFDTAGNPLTDALVIKHLWDDTGRPCEFNDPRDPIVRYDKQADRWLISGFIKTDSNDKHMCIAVSETADPSDEQWFLYDFQATSPDGKLVFSIDFPKLSVWPDAYYLSTVQTYDLGLDAWALERSEMLLGQEAQIVRFHLSSPGIALLPGDPDGQAPSASSPGWFARQVDGERVGYGVDRVEVYKFAVDWSDPDDSTFEKQDSLPVDSFSSILCTVQELDVCVPQADTNQLLETLSIWPQWRLQYRNMGEHESLLFNHTIDTNGAGHAGVRWYELRRPLSGNWVVYQQGTHHHQDLNYFMGSLSMDRKGNIALGYTASSSSKHPSIHLAHRMASDVPGSMPGTEYVAVSGTGSQLYDNSRWGNYSSMDVDPVDDCTFWYTSEYYKETSEAGWRTRILSFRLPGCDPPGSD